MNLEEIEFLRSLRLPYTKIASFLGVSRSTIYRRLQENGISYESKYTDISDSDLDNVIVSIKRDHPNDGERLVIGHLAARSILVPRARVRAAIHRVDPDNTALRRRIALRRRVYHVNGPNSLWHLDGHHKLIKWQMVTHGGIDGYSRTVVFLRCSDNNRAYTMLSAFTSGVEEYGLPERIRTDMGGEMTQVWQYMIEQHNFPNAVIVGSSTHNQGIERLWRDVHRCVGKIYHDLVTQLEDDGFLDPLNETDLYCLHFVFLPRINVMLRSFQESWNNHSLSSAGSLTPNQLFIRGGIEQDLIPNIPHNNQSSQGQFPTPGDQVPVPRIHFNPCSRLYSQITRHNFPTASCDDFGYDFYKELISIVGRHVSRCSDCS